MGVSPSGSGCQPLASAADASSQSGIPNAVLDAVASAIEKARCHGREGPYGGYDYGHNSDFYGAEPEGGRYVVRDFRDFGSPTWGAWVHQTHDADEHEQAYLHLTGRHIAEAAVLAYASAIEARSDATPKSDAAEGESAVAKPDAQPQSGVPSLVERLLDEHIQRCRDAVAECSNWSPAQAEWSRARDALLNFRDDLTKLQADRKE